MNILFPKYNKMEQANNTLKLIIEEDCFTGKTFHKIRSKKKSKLTSLGLNSYLAGSSIFIVHKGNSYFFNVPIYTRFKTNEITMSKLFMDETVSFIEIAKNDNKIKPIPVKEFQIKVNIVSIEKGIPKFRPFNELL